jgi:hypothetical protein
MAITSKLTSLGLMVDVRIVVAGLSSRAALAVEVDRIAMYGRENLCNMTRGGDGLVDPSPDVGKKISAAHKARFAMMTPEERRKQCGQHMKGRIVSREERERLRISSTGRKHSPDACAKIKAARQLGGIPRHVREAQRAAVTGKKRAPFKESTIIKMNDAARIREAKKREQRHKLQVPLQFEDTA